MNAILVFDQPFEGHFRRGVEVVSKALGGRPLLAPFADVWMQLLGWRGRLGLQFRKQLHETFHDGQPCATPFGPPDGGDYDQGPARIPPEMDDARIAAEFV